MILFIFFLTCWRFSEEAKTTQTAAANGTEQAEGDGAAEAGKYGFCVVCHKRADNYCSQTKDPVCSKACKMVRPFFPALRPLTLF